MAFTNLIKILVVEDNPGDVFLIKFYLEELDPENYEIQSVDNLTEAHYKLEREAFDVVLLDLHLPDSQGMITLVNSLEKFPDDVFIVLTSLSDEKFGLEAVKQGAQDFLVKGRIDSKALDSSIKFSFQRSKLQREIKILGSAYRNLELIYNLAIIVIDTKQEIVYHSKNMKDYLKIDTLRMDSIAEMYEIFEQNAAIIESVTTAQVGVKNEFEISIRGENFKTIVYRPKDQLDELILTLHRI